MKLGSLFDGIGGALLVASMCEIEPIWASEIEPFPIKVTKYHFPEVKHYGDITQINGAEVEPVDIIVGGSPCQDLSVAGKRAGLAGERSGLFMEQIRIVKEMRSATNKPRYMVWENVPGAFSSNDGEDFRAVLEETARVADPTVSIPRSVDGWANAGSILADGFSISWRTFDAQYWGVPQRRRRIYLVADFGGQSAPEILFECQSVPRHSTESRSEGQGIAENAERSITTAGGKRVTATITATYGTKWNGNSGADTGDHFILDKKAWQEVAEDAERSVGEASGVVSKGNGEAFLMYEKHMSLGCGGGQAGQGYPAVMVEKFARVAGFIGGNSADAGTIGYQEEQAPTCKTNANHVLCFEPGAITRDMGVRHWEEISPTLRAEAFDNRPAVCYDMSHAQDVIRESGEITPALQHRMGTGGNQVPITCYGISAYESNAMKSSNPHSGVYEADTARTIDQNGGNPACNQGGIAICSSVAFGEGGYGDYVQNRISTVKAAGSVLGGGSETFIAQKQVRRLTPLECERLQGYPDNYTNIPGASDSARYKALGNSFAIPNVYFVISKIKEANND